MDPQATKRTVRPDAETIKRLRLAKGWRVEDLATKAICSVKTIENIERGASVYVSTLVKIAKALGVEFVTLVPEAKPLPERTDLVPINEPPKLPTQDNQNPQVQITVDVPFGNFDDSHQLIDFIKQVKQIAQPTTDLTPVDISQVLLDYRSGKISKSTAMDMLDLEYVDELLTLIAEYGIGMHLTGNHFQSDPSAKPVEDYFTEDDKAG
jgi:transcriptional regulator with XRE-family HTH domain